MAKVTIVNEDSMVIVDGEALSFEFSLAANIHAIQWDGSNGHIEYNDGTSNLIIDSISDYQNIIDAHATEKQRLIDEEAQAEADRVAALTYADYRAEEYPTVEECVHALLDGGDTLTDLQAARTVIKDKYPKS